MKNLTAQVFCEYYHGVCSTILSSFYC